MIKVFPRYIASYKTEILRYIYNMYGYLISNNLVLTRIKTL